MCKATLGYLQWFGAGFMHVMLRNDCFLLLRSSEGFNVWRITHTKVLSLPLQDNWNCGRSSPMFCDTHSRHMWQFLSPLVVVTDGENEDIDFENKETARSGDDIADSSVTFAPKPCRHVRPSYCGVVVHDARGRGPLDHVVHFECKQIHFTREFFS